VQRTRSVIGEREAPRRHEATAERALGRLCTGLGHEIAPTLRDTREAPWPAVLERHGRSKSTERSALTVRLLKADPRLATQARSEDDFSRVDADRQAPRFSDEPRPRVSATPNGSREARAQPLASVARQVERRFADGWPGDAARSLALA
jgi:hypothetical protein